MGLVEGIGYDEHGLHPEGRHLVFVGDLVDRGPDSLSVVRWMAQRMGEGRASCVVGNHELNLALGKERAGNEWFWGREQLLRDNGKAIPQVLAGHAEREELLLFIQRLPLALERADLRVVHACWSESAVAALRAEERGLVELFYGCESEITLRCQAEGHGRDSMVADLARQNDNPVTALTSGLERPTKEPFRAGGKVRHVERVPWWQHYLEDVPVVFGHYWRALDADNRAVKRGPYLFEDHGYDHALGPKSNVYCIDYSIGYRNVARAKGNEGDRSTALGALRWPERELVLTH